MGSRTESLGDYEVVERRVRMAGEAWDVELMTTGHSDW